MDGYGWIDMDGLDMDEWWIVMDVDGWMDGYGCIDIDGLDMDGWWIVMDGWIDRCRWMDGWMDG